MQRFCTKFSALHLKLCHLINSKYVRLRQTVTCTSNNKPKHLFPSKGTFQPGYIARSFIPTYFKISIFDHRMASSHSRWFITATNLGLRRHICFKDDMLAQINNEPLLVRCFYLSSILHTLTAANQKTSRIY